MRFLYSLKKKYSYKSYNLNGNLHPAYDTMNHRKYHFAGGRETKMAKKSHERPNIYVSDDSSATVVIEAVLSVLRVFLPKKVAQKVVCIILLTADAPIPRVVKLTALTERCVRDIGRNMRAGRIGDVLNRRTGSGRKSKTANVEEQIITEVERKNYHTLQQIADMIKEKFRISLSLQSVSNLLKKTASDD